MLYCNTCGRSYRESSQTWRCYCGSYLNYQLPNPTAFPKKKIKLRPETMWRYREALQIKNDKDIVTLGEGMTPLVSAFWEGRDVLFKLDYLCPTGSFKDRGASFLISKLKELNITRIVEDSSGNAGAAIAAYCARAGIDCQIYVPTYTSLGKIVQITMYGAKVVRIPGNREAASTAAERAGGSIYYASHNWSPYFPHGVKTIAFEIWEQLGWEIPDNIIVPAGQGSLVLGCQLGFNALKEAGEIKNVPRIFAIQSANCAPLYHAFKKRLTEPVPIQKKETIAEGISSAAPVKGNAVLSAVRESGGTILSVGEKEIWVSLKKLAKLGFYVEPTSATATAGLTQLIATDIIGPDELTVVVLTGSGLKATDKISFLHRQGGDSL